VLVAVALTPTTAVRIRAKFSFTDQFNVARVAGEEYLVNYLDTDSFIPEAGETILCTVKPNVLQRNEFIVVENAVGAVDGKPRLGHRAQLVGPLSYFPHPGEQGRDSPMFKNYSYLRFLTRFLTG
jgi:hypothetical protein